MGNLLFMGKKFSIIPFLTPKWDKKGPKPR